MAVYTKHGQRLTAELARTGPGCYLGDKVFRIWAAPENRKKEQVYWVRDLLADNGQPEIEQFVNSLKRDT